MLTGRMSNSSQGVFHVVSLAIGLFLGIFFGHLSFTSTTSSSYFLKFTTNVPSRQPSMPQKTCSDSWQPSLAVTGYDPLGVEFTDEQWWENFDTNRTLYLAIVAGLGNTLQSMASALRIAYEEKINIKFVFNRNEKGYGIGPARWDELFSFPKINADYTFPDGETDKVKTKACGEQMYAIAVWKDAYKVSPAWTLEKDGRGEYLCLKISQWRQPPFPESAFWFYRMLQPTEEIQQYIKEFKKKHEWDKYQWIGVHVRRDRNGAWMKQVLTQETQKELIGKVNKTDIDTMIPITQYIKSMKKMVKNWPKHHLGRAERITPARFYLASDNDPARKEILEAFEDGEVVFFDHQIQGRDLRKDVWGMKATIVDLYMLAACRVFIGTPFSTFSEAARLIGNNLHLDVNFEYLDETWIEGS